MLYWHKNVTMPTYSTGELAYLSWLNKIDFVEITWHGMLQYDMKNKEERIHPTQKPIMLYRWLLDKYAEKGMKILDTHGGSMTIAKACDMEGYDLDICEIDKDYFNNGVNAFNEYKKARKIILSTNAFYLITPNVECKRFFNCVLHSVVVSTGY